MAIGSPRRRPHPAWRARNVVAGVSAAAFVGLGGAMALTHTNAASAASNPQNTRSTNASQPTVRPDDGFGDDGFGDNFENGGQQSFGGFGAQPAPQGQFQGFGSGGGSNTSSHGS